MKKKKTKLSAPSIKNGISIPPEIKIEEIEKENQEKDNLLIDRETRPNYKDLLNTEDEIEVQGELKGNLIKNEIRNNDSFEGPFLTNINNISSENLNWFIVSASVIGKSHLKSNIPCQDSHYYEKINDGWGVAICCDGAGSAANSHIGSRHVSTEIGATYFKELILKNAWHKNNNLPSEEEWSSLAYEGCIQIYNSLEELATNNQIELTSLACTLIVVIYSPFGLLVSHIGDGRAGYCNEQGEWKSLIVPHKGEESNQTIFITSQNWRHNSQLMMSNVRIPESRVIKEKPIAFTLMTDGCELYSFECSVINKETNMWNDPNLPYPKFFNPLVINLKLMHEYNVSNKDANDKWESFIEAGNEGLKDEPDDKTMILGVLI